MLHSSTPSCLIFEQLRPQLEAISRRIVGSSAEAEDVVQDCYFKWQAVEHTALATPAAWLTTVVRHHSLDRLRKRVRDARAARGAMELAAEMPSASPEEALLRRAELAEALARMLVLLSPSERLALVLHEVFECQHADVAAVLGTSTVNARQHLARARRRLRAKLPDSLTSERLCRELIRQFQAAINHRDMPAVLSLLGPEPPVSVQAPTVPPPRARASANDATYFVALAA